MKKILFLFSFLFLFVAFDCDDIPPIVEDVCTITMDICAYAEEICAIYQSQNKPVSFPDEFKRELFFIKNNFSEIKADLLKSDKLQDEVYLNELKFELHKVREKLRSQLEALKVSQ